jgi:hypothetical protein
MLTLEGATMPDDPRDDLPAADPDDQPIIDLDLDDLPADDAPLDVDLGAVAADSDLPAVTTDQEIAANALCIPCACSVTGQAFEARFEERARGVFTLTQVVASGGKAFPAKGGGGGSAVVGVFRIGDDFRCPDCKNDRLIQCDACGLNLCEGGFDAQGECVCPACRTALVVTREAAESVRGPVGGKKGKQG